MISPSEQTSHQNRWANYKASIIPSSIPSAVDLHGFRGPRLSFEGARQVCPMILNLHLVRYMCLNS